MAFRYYNPNPFGKLVGDCVVRATAKVLNMDWDTAYAAISLQGFKLKNMPSANAVWATCLDEHGFRPEMVMCQYMNPPCTVRSFADSHPTGRFLLFVGGHVVTVINGDYYDTWDSGDQIPSFYWKEKR